MYFFSHNVLSTFRLFLNKVNTNGINRFEITRIGVQFDKKKKSMYYLCLFFKKIIVSMCSRRRGSGENFRETKDYELFLFIY